MTSSCDDPCGRLLIYITGKPFEGKDITNLHSSDDELSSSISDDELTPIMSEEGSQQKQPENEEDAVFNADRPLPSWVTATPTIRAAMMPLALQPLTDGDLFLASHTTLTAKQRHERYPSDFDAKGIPLWSRQASGLSVVTTKEGERYAMVCHTEELHGMGGRRKGLNDVTVGIGRPTVAPHVAPGSLRRIKFYTAAADTFSQTTAVVKREVDWTEGFPTAGRISTTPGASSFTSRTQSCTRYMGGLEELVSDEERTS